MKDDILSGTRIRIPVTLVDGVWEFEYGGRLPIKSGAFGSLLVDQCVIEDKAFLSLLKQKRAVKLFDEGTELLVALTIKVDPALDQNLKRHLTTVSHHQIRLRSLNGFKGLSPDTRFVSVWLDGSTERQGKDCAEGGGGIWLHYEGLEPKGLSTGKVRLPEDVSSQPAGSLNHAFTLLSEKYEPWRRSHTGNIYSRIFYLEADRYWYPLDNLRRGSSGKDLQQLVGKHWGPNLDQPSLQPHGSG